MFTDTVKLTLSAGRGGNGVVAWIRAKSLPKGGPCGGNGGRGGSIVIETCKDLHSLDAYRNTTQITAEHGADGASHRKQGRSGRDAVLKVPLGTLVIDRKTNEILFDLTEEGSRIVLCEGGKGGLGNEFFKSATNRTPRKCTMGKPGEFKEIELELKLIADVGFVGLPNAGKSTLLSSLTPHQVKIGNYPFTTLKPNLSFIEFDDYSRVYLADIPGIIKDAHQGRGLGLAFLKHIERCALLVFILDTAPVIEGRDPLSDFALLREELRLHNPSLLDKPYLVALNKVDLPESKENVIRFLNESGVNEDQVFPISAAEEWHLEPLIEMMKALAQKKGPHALLV